MLTTLDVLLIHVKRCLQSEVFHYLARHRGTSQLFPGFTYFSTRILFANCFYYFRNISYCRLLFFSKQNSIKLCWTEWQKQSNSWSNLSRRIYLFCFQNIKFFCSFAREKPKSHSWSSTSNCFVCRSTEGITCHLFSKFKYIHPSIKTYFSIITIFPDILTFIFSLALQFGFPWQTDS